MAISNLKYNTLKWIVTILLVMVVYQNISRSFTDDSHAQNHLNLQKLDATVEEKVLGKRLPKIQPDFTGHQHLAVANEPEPLKFTENSPRIGVIGYVPYKDDQHYTIQFISLLYSSWKYVTSHPHLASKVKIPNYQLPKQLVIVDMLVWCAERACKEMPKDCEKFQLPYQRKLTPQCLYFPKEEHPDAAHNGWVNSFLYAIDPTFLNLTKDFSYFLRLDTDTLLAPGVLVWLPANVVAIDEGFYCTDFNKNRLEQIAKKLNLRNQQVHCIGSSWYAKSDISQALGAEVIRLTFHLIKNEFDPKLPGLEGIFKDNPEGTWPTWWRAVSLLYGSELALNSIVDRLNESWTKELLDQTTCDTQKFVMNVVQLHCYQDSCQFRKFDFMDAIISQRNSRTLDPRLFMFHSDRDVSNMSLRDYTTFIAWHGAANYVQHIRAWVKSALGEKFVDDIF